MPVVKQLLLDITRSFTRDCQTPGANNIQARIDTVVFGVKAIESIFAVIYYVHSLHATLMLSVIIYHFSFNI